MPNPFEMILQYAKFIEDLAPFLGLLTEILWGWIWFFLPFILWPIVKERWLFWREEIRDDPYVLLEIRIPGEMTKPIRAMETVLSGFWQIYGPPNWFEQWWEGKSNPDFSLEIASIDGIPHFLVRAPAKQRVVFEQHIYAQYPQAEINEVEDYTTKVPKNIPNEKWDIWGTDYKMINDCFPLRTYRDFETEREATEEKRIDPIASLLEGLSKLEKGEQLWIIIKAEPVTDDESGFMKKAKKEYQKLAGRKEKPPPFSFLEDFFNTLTGYPPKKEAPEDEAFPEMKLTPGEKEKVAAIERKMSKQFFKCFIRYAYIAKRDKFSGSRIKIPMSYFNHFNIPGMGTIIPHAETITKVKQNWYDWFWKIEERLYVKKRRMFRNFLRRVPAFFPVSKGDEKFILNVEELATIYHFPSKVSAPPSVIQRVEAKKKEAPHDLPTE